MMHRPRAWLARALAILGVSVVITASPPALAQVSRSDELFREGKALMDQSLVAEACEKFAESVALARRAGALLNLAVCREAQGRYATAVRLMQEAREMALNDGRTDRVVFADERLEALHPRLSWLRLHPPARIAPEELIVECDGEPWPIEDWELPRPVDPGPHTVVALAKGRASFHTTVVVGSTGDVQDVSIPPMVEATVAEGPVAPSPLLGEVAPSAPGTPPWWKATGWAAMGIGLSAVVVGGVFGAEAIGDSNASKALCPGDVCTPTGYQENRSANAEANVANVAIGAGLVAAGVGLYMLLTSSSAAPGAPPSTRAGLVRAIGTSSPPMLHASTENPSGLSSWHRRHPSKQVVTGAFHPSRTPWVSGCRVGRRGGPVSVPSDRGNPQCGAG